MKSFKRLTASLLAVLFQTVVIMAQFELEVRVEDYNDPVDDCGDGFDICVLYIDDICLGPQIEANKSCSLKKDGNDLDLNDDNLPRNRTLTVMSQPWPVDFQLYLEIKDRDRFNDDDHIDDIVIRSSLYTSSVFTAAKMFSGNRISLSLRFRVHCIGGYMGPYCDCLPHNDSINGHYQCEADGSISCLPGYTNTTGSCTQVIPACTYSPCSNETTCVDLPDGSFHCICAPGHTSSDCIDHCEGNQCPDNTTCVNGIDTYICQPLECNCENGGTCIEEDGVYSCVCIEGLTGDKCSTQIPPKPSPRPPQSREGSGGMSNAAIAGIVAGILLALLICALLIVVGLCVIFHRKRVHVTSTKPQNSHITKVPISLVPSIQSNLLTNPSYGVVKAHTTDLETLNNLVTNPSYGVIGAHTTNLKSTVPHMKNPLDGDRQNPMYGMNHKPDNEMYSIPHRSQVGVEEGDGGIYSVPLGGATLKYTTGSGTVLQFVAEGHTCSNLESGPPDHRIPQLCPPNKLVTT